MKRRTCSTLLALAAVVTLVVSSIFMARRIGEFHKDHKRNQFAFREVEDRSFGYAGHKVTVTDTAEGSIPYVNIKYGDHDLKLRVQLPGEKSLPGLKPYMDWMRIVRFIPTNGRPIPEVVQDSLDGKIADRLVIVTRELPPGVDPGTWGRVWRKDWIFTFSEFLPDGTFSTQRLNYPTTRRWQDAKPGELAENTWEMQAALLLIPKGMGPSMKPQNDALSSVGWTLPVAASSMLLILGSIVLAAGGRRTAPD